MEIRSFDIGDLYPAAKGTNGNVTLYLHTNFEQSDTSLTRPCMIVVPGGGYAFVSEREAEPVAIEFFNRGYNAAVLRYDVLPAGYPRQIMQLSCLVDYLRKNSGGLRIRPDKIFAVGFSAGGHLTGCLANAVAERYTQGLDCEVNGAALCYPVIYSRSGYDESHRNLLGARFGESEFENLELDKSVRADNPPVFVFTTAADTLVPSDNSLAYCAAYAVKKLPYELHVYSEGVHGASLADERLFGEKNPNPREMRGWVELADAFFKRL